MSKLVSTCPACENKLQVTNLSCTNCNLQLEGQFPIPKLFGLDPSELQFIVDFVRTSGSLKKMAKIEGISYPTLRTKLNELIEKLDNPSEEIGLNQHEILDAIAAGNMTAAEGAQKLKELVK